MGSTLSTAHRVQFRRALYLHYFDDKCVRELTTVRMIGGREFSEFKEFREFRDMT